MTRVDKEHFCRQKLLEDSKMSPGGRVLNHEKEI